MLVTHLGISNSKLFRNIEYFPNFRTIIHYQPVVIQIVDDIFKLTLSDISDIVRNLIFL